jgi:hypothetical protein
MAQMEQERTDCLSARVTGHASCIFDSFRTPQVERRRHCLLTVPHPVPLPGRARATASLDANAQVSEVVLTDEVTSATGDAGTPAATATIGGARLCRERPLPTRLPSR